MINTLAIPNIILAPFFFCSGKGKGGRAPAAPAHLTVRAAPAVLAVLKLQGTKKSGIFSSLFLLGGP